MPFRTSVDSIDESPYSKNRKASRRECSGYLYSGRLMTTRGRGAIATSLNRNSSGSSKLGLPGMANNFSSSSSAFSTGIFSWPMFLKHESRQVHMSRQDGRGENRDLSLSRQRLDLSGKSGTRRLPGAANR